jgi:hypothetical protein
VTLSFTKETGMPSQQTLDVVQRGQELYRDKLQALLEAKHPNQFVAIEPDSGDYFLGDTLSAAIGAARQAHPTRLAYALRIGHPAAVHLGVMAT